MKLIKEMKNHPLLSWSSSFSNNSSSNLTKGDSSSQASTKAATLGTSDHSSVTMAGTSLPTQMKVPHKTIEQLIIHNSDTAVKPIVGNKEIEKIQE